jgi:hypothetical protein
MPLKALACEQYEFQKKRHVPPVRTVPGTLTAHDVQVLSLYIAYTVVRTKRLDRRRLRTPKNLYPTDNFGLQTSSYDPHISRVTTDTNPIGQYYSLSVTMTRYSFSFVSSAAAAALFLSVGNAEKITISYQPATWWSLPVYMAEQNGYFEELGLEVSIKVVSQIDSI